MAWYHPLLFRLDAERAHAATLGALAAWGAAGAPLGGVETSPRLGIRVAGIDFANPVGLAAGIDKDAVAIPGWFGLGFGSVEVGTADPAPPGRQPQTATVPPGRGPRGHQPDGVQQWWHYQRLDPCAHR